MKLLKFIFHKIIIIEVMLIILYISYNLFNLNIDIIHLLLSTSLIYLTPISVIALIGYIILCLLTSKIIETIIGVVLGGIILYYIINYIK